jgi:hypothetical protein
MPRSRLQMNKGAQGLLADQDCGRAGGDGTTHFVRLGGNVSHTRLPVLLLHSTWHVSA